MLFRNVDCECTQSMIHNDDDDDGDGLVIDCNDNIQSHNES